MTEQERRHYQRIPFIADVLLQHDDKQWSCGLEDISLKGILVLAPQTADASKIKTCTVELVLGEGATISMKAHITHITESHWGMQWDNIELDSLTHLRRLLELNMDDTEAMHRELAELG